MDRGGTSVSIWSIFLARLEETRLGFSKCSPIYGCRDRKASGLVNHEDAVGAVAWAPDSTLFATSSTIAQGGDITAAVLVWDSNTGKLYHTYTQSAPVQSITFAARQPESGGFGCCRTTARLASGPIEFISCNKGGIVKKISCSLTRQLEEKCATSRWNEPGSMGTTWTPRKP